MTFTTTILKEKRIPEQPGVYLMKDSEGVIIYIGKAKNLRKRITSYFSMHDPKLGWKTNRLVSRISDIDFVVTDNEIEAFLLESNLIKRYRPVFNIELKDQQRYTYLKITDEAFPRLLVARRNRAGEFTGPKGRIYGPFVRGSSKYLTVGLLRKLFKIRVCNRLPKTPCLQYFIKNCDAPCIANVMREQYMMNIVVLQDILEGKSSIDKFAEEMHAEMKRASELGDYERAKEIRDTLYRLNNLRIKQKMEKAVNRNHDEEYVSILKDTKKGVAHVMALSRTRGVISDRKKFEFDLVGDNSLTKDKRQLMDLIMRNLSMYIERGYDPAVVELKNALKLTSMPEAIDCFDVSNLGISIAVGSCVRFINGKPSKSYYRRFNITTVVGQNDFAMIGELVRRRYSSAGEKIPDLILIDGGRGQLGAAIMSLRSLGISDTPCISLAKENEEIYVVGSKDPVVLPKSNAGLKMLQHARDEAHRFSLAYNIKLRKLH